MRPLVIIGAGGHGRETLDVVAAINEITPTYAFLGFLDDGFVEPEVLARRGARLLGRSDHLADLDVEYVIAVGSGSTRWRIEERLGSLGRGPATLVHPAATLGSDLRIGHGSVIAAGARLTTNVTLGRHVHLNVNAVVSHDCEVGDYTTLSPGVLVNGAVKIGRGAFLGTGTTVLPGREIGERTVIGAGAVVTMDVPAAVTAVGVPARWSSE